MAKAKAKVKKKSTVVKAVAPKATREAFTKARIVQTIAEDNELTKKQVVAVLDSLSTLIHRHVRKGSVGHFTLPGMFKITKVKKKATKARKGINPFTGEEQMFAAKPARNIVKVRPLKGLKDMVE